MADLLKSVVDDSVRVKVLMGAGVDPHLYKARPSDLVALQEASLVIYNGLHLEGALTEVLENVGPRKSYAVSSSLDLSALIRISDLGPSYDPHVWMDPVLWTQALMGLCARLKATSIKDLDKRCSEKQKSLEALVGFTRDHLAKVPQAKRVLVTTHDAFHYFAKRFGFEVLTLQGVSTASEASLFRLNEVIQKIKTNKIPAVFFEATVSPKLMEQVSRESGARLAAELLADSLGAVGEMRMGESIDSFEGMFRYNVKALAEHLGGTVAQ